MNTAVKNSKKNIFAATLQAGVYVFIRKLEYFIIVPLKSTLSVVELFSESNSLL